MPSRPLLDDVELPQVQDLETSEDEIFAEHAVPALEGDFLQRLGRRAAGISLQGVLSGAEAKDNLGKLREKFRLAAPVSFVADIVTAHRVDKVLIETLGIRELAGKPERFEYALRLREYLPPPQVGTEEPPPATEEESSTEVETEIGTLVVEVIVDGDPNFDFSTATVTVEGTQENGTPLSRTLTTRENNVWTGENFPLGRHRVRATVTDPQAMTGTEPAEVRGGQTTQTNITLRSGAVIATQFLVHFRFDKSFVEPCMRHVLKQVADYAANHTDEKLIIVGHTDKVGTPEYNQSLSERRARSVFAYLTFGRDPAAARAEWNELRVRRPVSELPSIKDTWDVREYQHILQDLGFYSGAVDGDDGPLTQDAVRAYRCHKGLPPGTNVDDAVWEELIKDYLAQDNLAVPVSQFLPNCPGEILKWLGCGEDDPVKNTPSASRPNRRVELLFVRTDRLPCQVPRPDTFNLPTTGAVNNNWCVGPPSGGSRCCFVRPADPRSNATRAEGAWTRTPAEPGTITVEGSIKRELPDGTLQPVPNQAFVLISPAGEFKSAEQSNGEPVPARTDAGGNFSFANLPIGFYSLEVVTPPARPVLVRLLDQTDRDVKGNAVCKALRPGGANPRLDVVIINAPVRREIHLPVVAHLMTALHPATREIRTCPDPLDPSRRVPQATVLTGAEVQAAFDAVNVIWRQARVRFDLENIVQEVYAFRTECEVDSNEFVILLERCGYPNAINVFFVGDLAGLGEAGFGLSPESAAAQGVAVSGCAVGDKFQTTVLGPPVNASLNAEQRAQVLAHELGHFLNLDHADDTAANTNRLMLPGTIAGSNRTLVQDEVNRARASRGAADDCVPLDLRVTGATQVAGTLSNQFIVIQNPGGAVTVDADIPDRLVAPGVGTLTMTGGSPGANDRERTVSTANVGENEIVATYTPAGGGQPVTTRVVVRIATFDLRVQGACRIGLATDTTFVQVQNPDPNQVITIIADIAPAPFCVPSTMVSWTNGTSIPDPLRRTVSRGTNGLTTVSATVAGTTKSVTITVVTFTLRIEGAIQAGGPNSTVFATSRTAGQVVTIVAEINPLPSPVPANLVTWTNGSPVADPLRRTVSKAVAAETTISADICGVTNSVTIRVAEVRNFTQTNPPGAIFDDLSDPKEPVVRLCGIDTADLRVDVEPNTSEVFYTANPAGIVDLNPQQRIGDGDVTIRPRAIPAGIDRAAGRDTRLSVRVVGANGPELTRNNNPARVRIRQFEEIVAHLMLHVVRRDDGTLPAGVTMNQIITDLNNSLDEANRLYNQACIRLRMRQRAGTLPKDRNYSQADLEIGFIDETDLLDISAAFDGAGGVTFPDNEHDDLFKHGGHDRNADNPTFINVYLISRFDGAGTLGGIGGGNHVTILRTMGGSLFAHELGHCLGLPDLDKIAGITDLDKRLMRSAVPRGQILTSSGTAGDETVTARRRALTFTG